MASLGLPNQPKGSHFFFHRSPDWGYYWPPLLAEAGITYEVDYPSDWLGFPNFMWKAGRGSTHIYYETLGVRQHNLTYKLPVPTSGRYYVSVFQYADFIVAGTVEFGRVRFHPPSSSQPPLVPSLLPPSPHSHPTSSHPTPLQCNDAPGTGAVYLFGSLESMAPGTPFSPTQHNILRRY